MPRQTESGKAWEYGLAHQLRNLTNSELVINRPSYQSQTSYDLLSVDERCAIDQAANEAIVFLRAYDTRLNDARRVLIQNDAVGRRGDVRDILVVTDKDEIGISAKHRHAALKHSRLSATIDFGDEWYGRPCSDEYWDATAPIFNDLRTTTVGYWRDLHNKHQRYYLPILHAFIDEIRRNADVTNMLLYLVGRFDFYKIIKVNGVIQIQSFNLRGKLDWGRKVPLPNRVVEFAMRNNSNTTADLFLDRGWALSFRIHNASSRIEPSLKFDVQLTGNPSSLANHEIPYGEVR